jgi:hypothetical protein
MDVEEITSLVFPKLKESEMSLSSILRRIVEAEEPVADAGLEPEFDFSHVPKQEAAPVPDTQDEEQPAEEDTPTDEPEAPEEEPEVEAVKTTRLLSIDKRKVNDELKELCAIPSTAIPLSKIKEVLGKYKLQLADVEIKFVGRAGNKDFDIANDKGTKIGNSQLIIYWNRDSDTSFTVNGYLS